MEKTDINSLFPEELSVLLKELGEPSFRSKQVFDWLHVKRVSTFDEMANIPKSTREKLNDRCEITHLVRLRKQVSAQDGTIKYLWGLSDGNAVESVLMSYEHGHSLCISSQVGCRMGCKFCASTMGGLIRNLQPSELLGQIYAAQEDAGVRVDNVVLMGIGEPLDNYDNVVKFLRLVSHPDGINIGLRHFSLSTCGLCDRIDRLAEEELPITLSVSLHAPDDESRSAIMPVNNRYNVQTLMDTCARYYAKTGRRISFEYTLVSGKNDTPEHAERLAKLVYPLHGHVNLINLNPVDGTGLSMTDHSAAEKFKQILEMRRVAVSFRRRLGTDIDAACGQLRRKGG